MKKSSARRIIFFTGNNERIPAIPAPKQIPAPILSKQTPNSRPRLIPIGK